ncbi:MAG: cation:proton antiporter [Thermotogota bacterium]
MTMNGVRQFFSSELGYIVMLFALFIVPRLLQRWRLPSAVTSLALGAATGMGFGLFVHDPTVHLLATLGIVALFLFAGLEADTSLLRRETRIVLQHLILRLLLLAGASFAVLYGLGLAPRPALLVALALLTPSTGFILDSLGKFGLSESEKRSVKSKAIATEMLALVILFFTLQSASAIRLVLATAALVSMVLVLPLLFRTFARWVAPYAPKSEFAFLVMMAILAAYGTRKLGVYYLVGAFLVGLLARRFRETLPAMASERMLHAVEVFASFFAPFYFFSAGVSLRVSDFSWTGLALGFVFLVIAVPVALVLVVAHRRHALGEPLAQGLRIAVPMVPTLVFSLVIVGILKESYSVPDYVIGGLVIYTLLNTLVPGLVLGTPPLVFDAPELPVASVSSESCAERKETN